MQGDNDLTMTSRQQFWPLCDLHHSSMRRLMLEEESDDIRSYHACERPGCTRIFRESAGYADVIEGQFDDSRAAVRACPVCGAALYLSEVNQSRKIEIWECSGTECEHSEHTRSPSAQ
jgi:hypothetical protein